MSTEHSVGGRQAPPTDRGSATAELAVSMPVLLVLLFAGLTAVGAATTRLQCVDAAREAALAAARGEPGGEAAAPLTPDDARVSITVDDEAATAHVSAPVPVVGQYLTGWTVTARSVAAVEPGGTAGVPEHPPGTAGVAP